MRKDQTEIISHYQQDGLLERLDAAFRAAGMDPDSVTADQLASVDEFHIGGRAATLHLIESAGISGNAQVLDVGCGIGGAARALAGHFGCHVTGIDLTPEYIEAARTLSARCGLSERTRFVCADALDMPFKPQSFDAVISLHAAMNIENRAGLYQAIARVLKPGGTCALYDVMRLKDGALGWPMPWASHAGTSFLHTPGQTRRLLDAAGFEVTAVENRQSQALEFFARIKQRQASGAAPGPGIQLVMGEDARQKIANVLAGLKAGLIAPVQMIARLR